MKNAFDWDRVQAELKKIKAASKPSHQNILNVKDHEEEFTTKKKVLWIFAERCELGDMYDYAKVYNLNVSHKLDIMHQVASGLAYLHNLKPHAIIHCYLKPQNIFFMDTGCHHIAKIGNFGVLKLIAAVIGSQLHTLAGTSGYLAPELYDRKPYDSGGLIDVFSAGVLCFMNCSKILWDWTLCMLS